MGIFAQERGNPNSALKQAGAGVLGNGAPPATEPSVVSAHRRTVKATHYASEIRDKLMEIAGRLDGGPTAQVGAATQAPAPSGIVGHMHAENDELRMVLGEIGSLVTRIDGALGQA